MPLKIAFLEHESNFFYLCEHSFGKAVVAEEIERGGKLEEWIAQSLEPLHVHGIVGRAGGERCENGVQLGAHFGTALGQQLDWLDCDRIVPKNESDGNYNKNLILKFCTFACKSFAECCAIALFPNPAWQSGRSWWCPRPLRLAGCSPNQSVPPPDTTGSASLTAWSVKIGH